MKNFYIALILFITILSASISGDIYIKRQMMNYSIGFKALNNLDASNAQNRISIMKNKFYKQKNMLRLFINKEHINNLETNIMLLENNVSQSDEIITESLCLISQITENIIL